MIVRGDDPSSAGQAGGLLAISARVVVGFWVVEAKASAPTPTGGQNICSALSSASLKLKSPAAYEPCATSRKLRRSPSGHTRDARTISRQAGSLISHSSVQIETYCSSDVAGPHPATTALTKAAKTAAVLRLKPRARIPGGYLSTGNPPVPNHRRSGLDAIEIELSRLSSPALVIPDANQNLRDR